MLLLRAHGVDCYLRKGKGTLYSLCCLLQFPYNPLPKKVNSQLPDAEDQFIQVSRCLNPLTPTQVAIK